MAEVMDASGVVVSVRDGKAEVRFPRAPACDRCGACGSSGTGEIVASLAAVPDLASGDRVRVGLAGPALLKAAAWAYLAPAAVLLSAVAAAASAGLHPAAQWACGLAAVAAAAFGVRTADRRLGRGRECEPRILEVLR